MTGILEYESDTKGLWARFFTKLITLGTVIFFFGLFRVNKILDEFDPIILINIFLLIISYLIAFLILYRSNPNKWKNSMIIDFDNEQIKVVNQKELAKAKTLDYTGKVYPFKEIENYKTEHYESFLFSSFYLTIIQFENKKIELVSIKSAKKFTELSGIFKNQLKPKFKESSYIK